MEESGNERAHSDAPTEHQDGTTDVKKEEVEALQTEVLFGNLFASVSWVFYLVLL